MQSAANGCIEPEADDRIVSGTVGKSSLNVEAKAAVILSHAVRPDSQGLQHATDTFYHHN